MYFTIRFCPKSFIGFILATDTSDPDIATRIGANFAPRLVNMSPDCCDDVYAFVNPVTPAQLPIVDNVQEYGLLGCLPEASGGDKQQQASDQVINLLQTNRDYTPIRCWGLFQLPVPAPGKSLMTLKSQQTTDFFVDKGLVTPVPLDPPVVTNSPFFREEIYQ